MSILTTVRNTFGRVYLDSKKKKREKKYSDPPVVMDDIIAGMYQSMGPFGYMPQQTYYQLVNSYQSWVYNCIDKIGKTISMLPLRLFYYKNKASGKVMNGRHIKAILNHLSNERSKAEYTKGNGLEKVEVFDHPFLDLMIRPNHLEPRISFWYALATRLELAGSVGILKVRDRLKIPRELWYLPQTWTGEFKPIPDSKLAIKGYMYVDGNIMNQYELDEIIWVRWPHPKGPFEGMSAIKAQIYPYNIDYYLQQMQYKFFTNSAAFGNVFTTDKDLTAAQITDLQAQMSSTYQNAKNAGKALFLGNGFKQDRPISWSSRDMMIDTVEKMMRDRLMSAYDVSAGKIGLTEHQNKANLDTVNDNYMMECIRPRTLLIEEYFEQFLLPDYDDRLVCDFDLPIFKNAVEERSQMESNLRNGVTTINEERKKMGMQDVKWGELPWMPFSLAQVGGEEKPAPAPLPVTKPKEPKDGESETETEKALRLKAEWSEEDHPRADDGKFTDGGGTEGHNDGQSSEDRTPAHVEGGSKRMLDDNEHLTLSRKSHDRLTDDERRWVDNYTGAGFISINNSLRKGVEKETEYPGHPEIVSDIVTILDSAIDKSEPLPDNIQVTRFVDKADFIPGVGESFIDRSFVSTTVNDNGVDFLLGVKDKAGQKNFFRCDIIVDKSVKGLPIGNGLGLPQYHLEKELLLQRGLKFTVMEKTEERILLKAEPAIGYGKRSLPYEMKEKKGDRSRKFTWEEGDIEVSKRKELKSFTPDQRLVLWKAFSLKHREWEGAFKRIMIKHFQQQADQVIERLDKKGLIIKGYINGMNKNRAQQWLAEHKTREDDININPKTEAKKLKEMVRPAYKHVLLEAGKNRSAQLRETVSGLAEGFEFNLGDPDTELWLGDRLEKFSEEVEGTTFDSIQEKLREGFSEGKPLSEMASNLRDMFDKSETGRAQTISRTETTASANRADLDCVRQTGIPMVKSWLNEPDARETHRKAGEDYVDGIQLDEMFEVGEDEMDSPGNGSLPEENCNCRCTMLYVPSEEE